MRKRLSGWHWAKIRKAAFRRAGGLCESCRLRPCTEAHHRIPVSQGGSDELDNVIACCSTCHRRMDRNALGHRPVIRVGQDGRPLSPSEQDWTPRTPEEPLARRNGDQ